MDVPAGARVSFFLGKGGVGKTTVAAAFALDRARAGERIMLLSLTSERDLKARFAAEAGIAEDAADQQPLPLGLEIGTLHPRGLVDNVVRRLTRLGAMGDLVIRQPGYESLVDIAPGIKEMAVLNHVWNLRQQGYDRIIVDGAATGHGLHFLEAPRKTATILAGRLRERALAIQAMLQDEQASEAVIVTLPEEMPVREATELAAALRREGFPLDNVVVNKWFPSVFESEGSRAILEHFEGSAEARRELGRNIAHRSRIDVEQWLAAIRLVRAERRESVQYLEQLRALKAKLALVPFLPDDAHRLTAVASVLKDPKAVAA